MAIGSFRKSALKPPSPGPEAQAKPVAVAKVADNSEAESSQQILELLEIELGGMIRQLERAASAVAGGAEATAATLSAVRQRTDALSLRSNEAQSTAATFSLVTKVNTGTANGTVITDTATVSSSVSDPNSANNTSSASTVVGAAAGADLIVTNAASPNAQQ